MQRNDDRNEKSEKTYLLLEVAKYVIKLFIKI